MRISGSVLARPLLWWRRWRGPVQVIIFCIALLFLALLMRSQWQALQTHEWHLSPGWLLISFLPWGLSMALEIEMWRSILFGIGETTSSRQRKLSWSAATQIWFLSAIIRYIPGNVWQPLGMAQLSAQEGIRPAATFTSIVVHQALSGLAVALMGTTYFLWVGQLGILRFLLPILIAVPALAIGLQARWLESLLNWLLRRVGRDPLHLNFSSRTLAGLVLGYIVSWSLLGLGFAALVRALTPIGWDILPHLIPAFALAWLIGYLSLLTPSGLGVREGVLVWLLGGLLTMPVATVASLVQRLWFIVAEAAAALVSLVMWRRRRKLDVETLDAETLDA